MSIKCYDGGFGNIYVTDKVLQGECLAEFDSVSEAEDAIDAEEGLWEYLDRDLLHESSYSFVGDDYELHTFDAREFV